MTILLTILLIVAILILLSNYVHARRYFHLMQKMERLEKHFIKIRKAIAASSLISLDDETEQVERSDVQ